MTKSVIQNLAEYIQILEENKLLSAVERLSAPAKWASRDKIRMGKRLRKQNEQLNRKCEQIGINPTDDNIQALINDRKISATRCRPCARTGAHCFECKPTHPECFRNRNPKKYHTEKSGR